MNRATMITITDELTDAGWFSLDPQETDPWAPIIRALQRHRVKADDRAVSAVLSALEAARPKPAPEPVPEGLPEDLGFPLPTVEELAEEAAWVVDRLFMFALAFEPDRPWAFTNADVTCDVLPVDVRRTCFRTGLAVAAAHGCPDNAPTMRQVADALIRRLSKDRRIQR